MKEIHTVLVVGAGVMGHGFAQVFALNGIDVILVDQNHELLDRAQGWIRENLEFMVELELIKSPEIEAALNRIRFTSDLNGSAPIADYVLEAITEDLELKKSLFKQLGTLAGADVILADEDSRMGGRLNAERDEVDGRPGVDWAASVVAELKAMGNVRLMPRTTVTGAYDHGTWSAIERVAMHLPDPGNAPREAFWRIVARRAILAAGALDRPVAFQNNDRPGIMLASAVRSYLNRYAVVPGRTVTVFGNRAPRQRRGHVARRSRKLPG